MKRIVGLFLAFILIFSMSTTAFAAESVNGIGDEVFSYYNDEGEIVTIAITRNNNTATSKVYVDGILTQKAVASAITKTIETEIYDLPAISRNSVQAEKSMMNDFTSSVIHAPVSTQKINVSNLKVQARSLYNEPVDNSGLSSSGYGDGYYSLGSYGGYYYAPDVYGYLYRKYTRTYDGETKHWSWGARDTVGAISAYISLFGGPVSAIIAVLLFTASEVLMYDQAIDLATYTYDYSYRVRVYGTIHFTTQRNITYWRIDNVTTGTTKWEEKSFNYGFSMANTEMAKAGIDNYLLSIQ
jgi:hypothetical protein